MNPFELIGDLFQSCKFHSHISYPAQYSLLHTNPKDERELTTFSKKYQLSAFIQIYVRVLKILSTLGQISERVSTF